MLRHRTSKCRSPLTIPESPAGSQNGGDYTPIELFLFYLFSAQVQFTRPTPDLCLCQLAREDGLTVENRPFHQ